jgi:ribonuclease Z
MLTTAGLFVAAFLTLDVDIRVKDVQAASEKSSTELRSVYFPGTEELAPDEIRIIACGSGMPMPRLKQAAACFLI